MIWLARWRQSSCLLPWLFSFIPFSLPASPPSFRKQEEHLTAVLGKKDREMVERKGCKGMRLEESAVPKPNLVSTGRTVLWHCREDIPVKQADVHRLFSQNMYVFISYMHNTLTYYIATYMIQHTFFV